LFRSYNLNLPTGDYETIAGYIISHISRIPNVGENIKIDNHNFYIVRGDQKKIDLIKLTVLNHDDTKI
ncbi:HlyC/CorC family transporter, partial [Candidatus Parcubacteria bacterium]